MAENIVSDVKNLADVGFLFVFGLASMYALFILSKYIARILEAKDRELADERKQRENLALQTLKVVENNTEAFRSLLSQLTDFMQEGRLHHKEVTGHLINLVEQKGFTQKPMRRIK